MVPRMPETPIINASIALIIGLTRNQARDRILDWLFSDKLKHFPHLSVFNWKRFNMTHNELLERLPSVSDALVRSIDSHEKIKHLEQVSLPNRDRVIACLDLLRQLIYPGYFGAQNLTAKTIRARIGDLTHQVAEMLYEQVQCSLRYQKHVTDADRNSADSSLCEGKAGKIVSDFLDRIPAVRELLASDVLATVEGDPAALGADEAIFCYPGVHAIAVQRLAHELFNLEVPLLPRIMTEHAHGVTGVDIHPKVKLGRSFYIDHGTGVVIGETAEIGNNVKIHQGVTLGGPVLFAKELKVSGQKRHPTIQDDVTIFSGVTILGNVTIGKGAILYPNVYIRHDVPEMHVVETFEARPRIYDRREKSDNYHI
jgi:serine O-acetyltransferase